MSCHQSHTVVGGTLGLHVPRLHLCEAFTKCHWGWAPLVAPPRTVCGRRCSTVQNADFAVLVDVKTTAPDSAIGSRQGRAVV